jgi:hypothetical protein
VLVIPNGAQGRRLKCPHCGHRFHIAGPEGRPGSSEVAGASPKSTVYGLPTTGEVIPRADKDLRETFDLPLLMDGDPAPRRGGAPCSDAAALFQDGLRSARKPGRAEARAKPRHCGECGATIPAGMSLCQTCGLDADTGTRMAPDESFFEIPQPSRTRTTPIGIAIVGGTTFLGSAILAIVSLAGWAAGESDFRMGFGFLGLVSAFGIYASVELLRLKSIRPLLIALSLGAMVDIVALIGLPAYRINSEVPAARAINVDDDEPAVSANLADGALYRKEMPKIKQGFVLLSLYAGLVLYLLTPSVQRRFKRVQSHGVAPIAL